MKTRLACVLTLTLICAAGNRSAVAKDLKFTNYKIGYSWQTVRVSKIKQFHFVFRDFKSFAEKFDAKPSRFYKGPKITKELFKTHIVLGALKVGRFQFRITPQKVRLNGSTLEVHYKVDRLRKAGLIRSVRMLVSIPTPEATSVRFIENGKLVHTMKLK